MINPITLYKKQGIVTTLFFLTKTLWAHFFKKNSPNTLTPFRKSKTHYRGIPELIATENNNLVCDACMLCNQQCPTNCIHITSSETSGIKQCTSFQLEILKCISCGECANICPIGALRISANSFSANYAEKEWIGGISL